MSARDELACIIHDATCSDSKEDPMTWPPAIFSTSDAILAAGYRKPRIITTAEELDDLPETSVVLDPMGTVALQVGRGLWTMGGDEYTSEELIADWLVLPATVLHEPEAQS